MKLKIISVKDGSFTGSDGERVEYFYHKAVRDDDVNFEFGSLLEHAPTGELEVDLNLEKYEKSNGRQGWREVLSKRAEK